MYDSQTRRSAIVLVTQVATRLLGLGALLVAAAPPMAGQEPGNDSGAGVLVERNIRIPMSDDVTLAADVIRPEQAEPVPALVIVSPYGRTPIQARAAAWARRGYAVVFVDSRGTFDSGGEYYPYVNEGRDAYDVQQWIGRQPWSDGKVGMWGKSYPAFIELLSAPFGSPHLQAVIPVSSQSDNFSQVWYSDGLLHLGIAFRGALYLGGRLATIDPRAINWMELMTRLPLQDTLDEEGLGSGFVADVIRHSTYDDFWPAMSLRHRYGEMDVPALHVGGWYDPNVHETIFNFTNMREQSKSERARRWQHLIIGPWTHANREIWFPAVSAPAEAWDGRLGDAEFGPDAAMDHENQHLRWFDYHLKGIDNGLEHEAPIRIFVMGENIWRDEWEWPLSRAIPTRLHLHSRLSARTRFGDGRLGAEPPVDEPPDTYLYDPRNPVPTWGGTECCTGGLAPGGPLDQRVNQGRLDVLVFTTDPLDVDTEVTGAIKLRLFFSTNVPDTDFFATVSDVYPDGRAVLISQGMLRTRYRESLTHPTMLTPGEVHEVTITFSETSNVFKAGHRIRLHITSSDFPRFDRNLNTAKPVGEGTEVDIRVAEQVVYHDAERPSSLLLPVIPQR
ncbi:MAG: CocE/NonD family hydrolase [Nitrospiraceae bacterium]